MKSGRPAVAEKKRGRGRPAKIYEVEAITESRKKLNCKNKLEYLVKWVGWDDENDLTWESEESLAEGSLQLLQQFKAKLEKSKISESESSHKSDSSSRSSADLQRKYTPGPLKTGENIFPKVLNLKLRWMKKKKQKMLENLRRRKGDLPKSLHPKEQYLTLKNKEDQRSQMLISRPLFQRKGEEDHQKNHLRIIQQQLCLMVMMTIQFARMKKKLLRGAEEGHEKRDIKIIIKKLMDMAS